MALEIYRKKRKFDVTTEPRGHKGRGTGNRYVIQKHDASRLHYDLRLELDGVMKSWAVTRGPSLDPGEKRLAVEVEDHPIEYNSFEGTIPEGEYGGGTVMIWDRGRWIPDGDPHEGYAKGHLDFMLDGDKLHGRWHLVRMRPRKGDRHKNWLLIKGHDEESRNGRGKDILKEKPLSVASGRTMDEIAEGKGRKNVRQSKAKSMTPKPARGAEDSVDIANVHLTHPGRVYWTDAGVTKEDLAEYYVSVWDVMAPHVVNRPLAIVRCPDGTAGECFFQKHIASNIKKSPLRHTVKAKEHVVIAVEKLADLVALVQSAALEVHVRGSKFGKLEVCDRIVFDLDPGEGVGWKQVVAAAQEVRDRLEAEKLKSFVKLSGGKGVHVVAPIDGAGWDAAKDFTARVASAMAKDSPKLYLAKMTKALRKGRIFIDYLRNTREATSVAAYSTRARPGAPVSMPVSWEALPRTTGGNQFTMLNAKKQLKQNPWAEIGKVRQKLPK